MYSCLVIGLGKVGMGYDFSSSYIQSHCKAINFHRGFYLAGAVEKSKIKRLSFEKKFKKPSFKNCKSALEKIYPEIIIICSSTKTHLPLLKEILSIHKPRVIVCEKPMGENFKNSLEILNICKTNRIKLFVNYARLSDPGIIKLKKIFKKPIEGLVLYSRGTLNNASHFLNMLQFWFGTVIKKKLIKKGNKFGKFDFNSTFIISFKNAKFTFKPISNFDKYTNSIIINDKDKKLIYSNGGKNIYLQYYKKDKNNFKILNKKIKKIYSYKTKSQLHFMNNLYYSLKQKKNNICKGIEAIKTLQIINSLYEKR